MSTVEMPIKSTQR